MARTFVSGSSQYLEVDTAAITTYPFTMACWFNVTNATAFHTLMFIGDKDVGTYWTALAARGDIAGDRVGAYSSNYGAGASQAAHTSTGFSVSTWHHACGTWTNASSRSAYIDGGSKSTDANAVGAMANHDRTTIGRAGDSSPSFYANGQIAETAIWDVVLTDAEVAILSIGYTPPFVRPENLILYLPLVRGNDQDIVGGLSLTAFNTPTIGDHPRTLRHAPILFPHIGAATAVFGVQGKGFTYTAANWPGLTWYFEVDMRATAGVACARLWDITIGASVVGSEITTNSTTFVRQRSNALTLIDNHKYRAEFGTVVGDSGETCSATVIGI